ncbi:chitin deacetylase [Quaeritorhiza haematococci]|nr:chitin deacetylase [Quaeritorhiza haematococci]
MTSTALKFTKILISLLAASSLSVGAPITDSESSARLTRRAPLSITYTCHTPGDFALTFDDGPHPYTRQVLDVLKSKSAPATFFVNGDNGFGHISQYATELRRMLDEGHQIAHHTFSHPNLVREVHGDEALADQIFRLERELVGLVGIAPAYFRPPYGEINERQLDLMGQYGFRAVVNWNINSEDYEHPAVTPENIDRALSHYHTALSNASPQTNSFIALNHDIQPVTADVQGGSNFVARVIDLVRGAGYRLVTVSECLGTGREGAYKDASAAALRMRNGGGSGGSGGSCSRHHEVKEGETCWGIASQSGIGLWRFMQLNPGVCGRLHAGQQVCVAA